MDKHNIKSKTDYRQAPEREREREREKEHKTEK
jgi:hypothetical protein